MVPREFCCTTCALYFWESIDYNEKVTYSYICPHCKADREVYAVDTFGWAYAYHHYEERLKGKTWSSQRFAPEFAIEHYKRNGMTIVD